MKAANQYFFELDSNIIEFLLKNPRTSPCNSPQLRNLAKCLKPGRVDWRVVDNRVQSLRKRGKISYAGRKIGWIVENPE
jgi:hypothetical protein